MSLRAFVPNGTGMAPGAEIQLDADESRYVARVRRARVGDQLDALSDDERWRATILAVDGAVRLRLDSAHAVPHERRVVAHSLIVGTIDRGPLEDAVRHATVMGAAAVIIARFERSQRRELRVERLARIVHAARRQCGRADRPLLSAAPDLVTALASVDGQVAYGDPGASPVLSAEFDAGAPATVVIGPEGGLTEAELEILNVRGAVPLFLGPWPLRSQTAVIAAFGRLLTPAP